MEYVNCDIWIAYKGKTSKSKDIKLVTHISAIYTEGDRNTVKNRHTYTHTHAHMQSECVIPLSFLSHDYMSNKHECRNIVSVI